MFATLHTSAVHLLLLLFLFRDTTAAAGQLHMQAQELVAVQAGAALSFQTEFCPVFFFLSFLAFSFALTMQATAKLLVKLCPFILACFFFLLYLENLGSN